MIDIIIDAPGKNALGSEVMASLRDQLTTAKGKPVLLRGAGDAFSAGLNLKEVVSLDQAGMERFLNLLEELTVCLFDYPGPTVALVNGHAIAGGCVLALCCDLRVAAQNPRARIGLNEVALGLRFPPRLLRILQHQVPRLDSAVLGAELHDPEAARALGFLDAVVDDAEAVARQRLEVLAGHPADAYAAAKADLRAGVTRVDPDQQRRFREEVVPVWASEAIKERIRAVLERLGK